MNRKKWDNNIVQQTEIIILVEVLVDYLKVMENWVWI